MSESIEVLYTDGFCIGCNPSRSGGGYLICDDQNKILAEETIKKRNFTNNEAELLGLLKATELISPYGLIYSDSQCAIAWVKLGYGSRKDLVPKMAEAKKNIKEKKLTISWTNRERNLAGVILEERLNKKYEHRR